MPIPIVEPGDPRLDDYIALTDVELRRRYEADRGCFIVEGILAIEALLQSPYGVRSVLVTEKTYARLATSLEHVDAPVYVVDDRTMRATVGFDLHRGAVASARRPAEPDLDALLAVGSRLLVLGGVNDHENVGALFRNAAAFGTDAVLLDPSCADPLYRRAIRVPLGHVLRVPFTRVPPWPGAITRLHDAGWTTIALTPSGDELLDDVAAAAPERVAVLVGAEGPGLAPDVLRAAHRRVRIPVAAGVDSLNVATAAAIALYGLRR